ncbi:hypothetical protein N7539_007336 [Penicillium diatomitis]|uniref:Uncharacterized protein n=1 Tax=Penicillium diatomitis TaxID=2819901 RepID=A0A9W9WV21_9EURO|nr:uncharacterized protein N7539_007336 [Penicillium diatomitis]KAJ5477192.1 hypothetical protein N7539_007336 [Penicillium diatomitis]
MGPHLPGIPTGFKRSFSVGLSPEPSSPLTLLKGPWIRREPRLARSLAVLILILRIRVVLFVVDPMIPSGIAGFYERTGPGARGVPERRRPPPSATGRPRDTTDYSRRIDGKHSRKDAGKQVTRIHA